MISIKKGRVVVIETGKFLNAAVSHCKFGKGLIVEVKDKHVTVEFEALDENKVFTYPDAFEKFLHFEDGKLQDIFASDWKEQLIIQQLEKNRKLQEYHRIEAEKKKEKIALLKKRQKAALAKAERERNKQRLAKMIG